VWGCNPGADHRFPSRDRSLDLNSDSSLTLHAIHNVRQHPSVAYRDAIAEVRYSFGKPLDHVHGSLYSVDAKSVQEFLED
jgi:hypothetical protein